MDRLQRYVIIGEEDIEKGKYVALIKVDNSKIIDKCLFTTKRFLSKKDIETARDFISNELVITNKHDLCKKIGIPDKKILRPGFDIEWAIERFEEKIAEIYNNFMKEWENADDTQVFIVCYLIYQDVEMYRYIWNNARL